MRRERMECMAAASSPRRATWSAQWRRMCAHCASSGGGGSSSPVARKCLISAKIHGALIAARPSMTPRTPVFMRLATSPALARSPFPITGMRTAAAVCAITSQSATPL